MNVNPSILWTEPIYDYGNFRLMSHSRGITSKFISWRYENNRKETIILFTPENSSHVEGWFYHKSNTIIHGVGFSEFENKVISKLKDAQ